MNINYSLFFKVNLFITLLIFIVFLGQYTHYTGLSFGLTLLGALSTGITLYLIFYLLLFIFSWTKTWILYLSMSIFILTDIALIVDFFIYKLFHFHINAMVLNIITSPDAMDSVQTGVLPFIVFFVIVIAFIFFEFKTVTTIQNMPTKKKQKLNSKINKLIILPFFLIILTEKVSFGMASLFSKNDLIVPFKVIPLYQPLTFNRIAAKYFGFKGKEQAQLSIKTHSDLNYPLEPIVLNDKKPNFNIFILASDAVKYTIVNEKYTPNIMKFSKDALVFKNHYSGGNSTRFGIFSLMYGLNSTYWFSFLNSNQKPVLFDVLQKENYDISIISSTNTNWPEFRKTCYVNVQDDIQDAFKGEPWKKDAQSTECFIAGLSEDIKDKKRFSFIFLDSPHGYSYPPNANIYHAPNEEVNYLALTKESDALQTVIKRYKNAIAYNDVLFGKMIAALKKHHLYDNSLIIYTSDHGQEFFEQGNFGHNTAFSKAQLHVPLMIKLPKSLQNSHLGAQINQSLTSHQDIVPSLLTLLGVKNDPDTYSNGANFFADDFHQDYHFAANWNHSALLTKETISVFSNLPNKIFSNEVHDTNSYKLYKDKKPNSKFLLDVIHENKKFLK
jgi:membrane-anchored protein YejM (alkaline phosphatase superfamily)